jgi:hypothetical protein
LSAIRTGRIVIGSALVAIGVFVIGFPVGQAAGTFGTERVTMSVTKADGGENGAETERRWLALELKHIGVQDRGVPVLLLHSRGVGASDSKLLSACGRSAECYSMDEYLLNKIAEDLLAEFPRGNYHGSGQPPPCTYEVSFESRNEHKLLKLDPSWSSHLLDRLLSLIEDRRIRERVGRLRDLCPG